jgi:hypothetical protein
MSVVDNFDAATHLNSTDNEELVKPKFKVLPESFFAPVNRKP